MKIIISIKNSLGKNVAFVTDDLKSHFDILATLYSLSRIPHSDPQPNDRGIQIAGEFYNFAKTWLQ